MKEYEALNMTVGQRIKALRKMKQMTQGELAKASKVDRSYISNVENGRRNASMTFLYRVCRTLDVTLRDFFADDTFSSL